MLHGDRLPPKALEHHNGVRNAPFSPVVLKKTRTFPELLLHTAAPQMASTTPPPFPTFANTLMGRRMS